jgi:hypothetical protein
MIELYHQVISNPDAMVLIRASGLVAITYILAYPSKTEPVEKKPNLTIVQEAWLANQDATRCQLREDKWNLCLLPHKHEGDCIFRF